MDTEKILEKYDYKFPEKLIAQKPASPRDSARLLIYNRKTKKIQFDRFKNLARYLPPKTVLVLNRTKVIPARLEFRKETGGKVRCLYLGVKNNLIEIMADRKLAIGSKICIPPSKAFTVKRQSQKFYYLKPDFVISSMNAILKKYGRTPLPPYIKHSPLSEKERRERYQTIFAKTPGSVAAPTASLHFTKPLFARLRKSGVKIKFITLHVNLGTFSPVNEDNFKNKKLHSEFFEIDKKTAKELNQAKKIGWTIIPVGTTALRTLESAAARAGELKRLSGKTELFIQEGYGFKFVDGLVTNFHVPRSSLMMLASAIVGREKLLNLYKIAIGKKFRLFSFGDGMLIN